MRQFIQNIPGELEDAARIDGKSDFGIYIKVILPLCIPGLAVPGLFTFTKLWCAFLWPLIVATSDSTRTISPGLRQPANKYVATFMGNPEMNFLEAGIARDG